MPYTASQLTTFYVNANMGITPSAAESLLISAYATQDANGALTDAQTLTNVIALSQDKTDVALATYEFFTGASPTLAGLSYLVHGGGNANDLSSAYYANFNKENRYYNFAINLAFGGPNAAGFASTYGSMTISQALSAAYETIVGTANVGAANAAAAQASILASLPYFQAVASQRASAFNQDLATKAIMIGYILEEAIKADVGTYAKGVDGFMNSLATTGTATTGDLLVNYPAVAAGVNFALTTGIDTFVGGAGNDTVTSTGDNGGASGTLTALDNINGGGGNNVFNLTDSAGLGIIAAPASATIVNFQTVNLVSTAGIAFDTTKITGATQLNATANLAVNVTAAATTNVTATGTGVTVNNGNNVTAVDAGGADTIAGAAGTISLTNAAQAGNAVSVNGGTNVTINASGNTGGTITVGATTAPTGSVSVTDTVAGGTGAAVTGGAIAVTGGTSVNVTENITANTTIANTTTAGAVTVTGGASTTSVSVSETAAAAATAKLGPIADGAVTVNDVNAGLAKAGTISTISLSNVASATISDNALATLNVSGVNGAIGITENAGAGFNTPTLGLNLNGATTGIITDVTGVISTVNVSTSGTTSTVAGITDAKLTTLNVSGSAGGLALTAVNANIATLTVTGAASFSGDISGTAVKSFAPTSTGKITATISGAVQSFAGGAGTDVITTATDAVKTITGGSAGNNEIILNNTAATFATLSNVTNFQILGTGAASSGSFDLSKLPAVTALDVQATGGAVVFTKVASGTSLAIDSGAVGGAVTYQVADSTGATDQVGVTLGTATTGGITVAQQLTLEDAVLAGIGTVVITSSSKAPVSPAPNFVNVLGTLNDTGMTSLTFTGNADTTINTLVDNNSTVSIANAGTATNTETIGAWTDNNLKSLTLSGNVALTLTDGLTSGVTVAGGSDHANVSLTLAGAGAGKADAITLGNGNDTVVDTGTGSIAVTLGNGTNTVTAANGSLTVVAGTGANVINANSAGVNSVTIGASGTKAETVSFNNAAGTNSVSFGTHTGVDNVSVAAHGSSLAVVATGLNSSAGTSDTITFLGDGAAAGAVLTLTTAQINAYANSHALDATQFSTALAAAFDTAANGGMGLAQHGVGAFAFQGNTYIVEQANLAGTAVGAADTVVELVGVVSVTGASAAAAGVLTLHG